MLWFRANVNNCMSHYYFEYIMHKVFFAIFLIVFCLRVIKDIFTTVDEYIKTGTLIKELNMSALPNLYDQSVELIKYLVNPFFTKQIFTNNFG